jgi:hypothetical protein
LPAAVVALAAFAILTWRFKDHTVDDAFITFRYAKNLASGFGPVYNVGERVEGYTNFLWMLLLAAGAKLQLQPEAVSRWLGVAFGAGAIGATAWLAGATTTSWRTWIPPAFLAVHPAFASWGPGGLEVPMFACLLTWGVGLAALESDSGTLKPLSALLLGLASLTRPEGIAVAGLVAAIALAPGRRMRVPPFDPLRNGARLSVSFGGRTSSGVGVTTDTSFPIRLRQGGRRGAAVARG